MLKRYFEILEDVQVPGRWSLDEPVGAQGQKIDPWQFRKGQPVSLGEDLKVALYQAGKPMDFSTTPLGVTPIVHARIASMLTERAPEDVQLLPVQVEARTEPYFLVNATRMVKCIDDEASEEVQYWKPEDGRPEKTGKYRAVYGMRIDAAKVGEAKVFRPWGWSVALIVSEDIKEALEGMGATGLKFEEVTGPSLVDPAERARYLRSRELLQQAETTREAMWRTLGRLEEEAIIPIVVGGGWPSRRQVWRIIHRPRGHLLLVTDGLSDPFAGQTEPSVGFGLELALEVDKAPKAVEKSWPLLLLERVANEVAEHEHVRERLKSGLLSMEVSGKGVPKSLITREGRVAVLLGLAARTLPPHFSTPAGEVKLVTVKVLLPGELAYLLEHGKEGQEELARRFTASSEEHVSQVRRRPIV